MVSVGAVFHVTIEILGMRTVAVGTRPTNVHDAHDATKQATVARRSIIFSFPE